LLLNSLLAVVIQTPNSPVRNFSAVIRVDISNRSATGLFFDVDAAKVDGLLQRLEARRDVLQRNPLSFIGILFEEHGYSCERSRAKLDRDIVEMEQQTGHTSLLVRPFQPNQHDPEQLIKDLNACNTTLIFMDSICVFEKEIGAFCKETLEVLECLREERGLESLSIGDRVSAIQELDYHLNLSQMRRTQALALQKRVQTQIRVVRLSEKVLVNNVSVLTSRSFTVLSPSGIVKPILRLPKTQKRSQ